MLALMRPGAVQNSGDMRVRGEILSYDDVSGTGLISGDDSIRYGFARSAIQAGARDVVIAENFTAHAHVS